MADTDPTFYERADAIINVANQQVTQEISHGSVSASTMYAVARYNAFVSAGDFDTVEAFKAERKEVTDYFVEEYRKMLEEHLDDHIENFTQYFG